MNISYDWLRAFVPFRLSPAELRDLITARTATVDEVQSLRSDLSAIVVGRVVEAARHPNADTLSITKVDAGTGELLDVVCGAPNVKAGATYPFAPVGVVMPNGMKIEKRKIRGETSNGMLCSSRELGLGDDHEGILELEGAPEPGTPLLRVLPVGDWRVVVDVTPNRPDLLSHLGVAREVAALTGIPLTLPPLPAGAPCAQPERSDREGNAGDVLVRLEDTDGAPRYMGVVIEGVTVGPSPGWLVQRLAAIGARPINNVVDVTNYILHELGQPMHAFDVAKLRGGTVIVRRARPGESIVTLDHERRALEPSMTVIADGEGAQAVAGVMGGAESEVREKTTKIFLEVACFDPRRTRATRKSLGLASEASYRFERGVDTELAPAALRRAVALITAIAGGTVKGTPVDLHPAPRAAQPLIVRVSRVTRLLGDRVAAGEITTLLRAIGFRADVVPGTEMLHGEEEIAVAAPSWRRDIAIEADVIEEIARLRGYDTFSVELRPFRVGSGTDHPHWTLARTVRDALVAEGMLEARPMPFVAGIDSSHVRVANPLAENEAHLRRTIVESLARRAEHNLAHLQGNVRLFEIGSVFSPSSGRLPREALHAGVLVMGDRRPPHFSERTPPPYDEWDAKAIASLLARTAFPGKDVRLHEAGGGVLWRIAIASGERDADRLVGSVERVPLDSPPWAAPAFGVEIELDEIENAQIAPPGRAAHASTAPQERRREHVRFRPLPVTPPAVFDLALVVPDGMPVVRVEQLVRSTAGDLLESLDLLDEYRGAPVPSGHRSLAWRLTFRHPERTLRDKEVDGRRHKLLRTLETELGVTQRTG